MVVARAAVPLPSAPSQHCLTAFAPQGERTHTRAGSLSVDVLWRCGCAAFCRTSSTLPLLSLLPSFTPFGAVGSVSFGSVPSRFVEKAFPLAPAVSICFCRCFVSRRVPQRPLPAQGQPSASAALTV